MLVISFIPNGPPFANKTTNFSGSGLLACDDGCKIGLVADDLDPVIIDADLRDHGPEIGLAGLGVGGGELLIEETGKGSNPLRRERA